MDTAMGVNKLDLADVVADVMDKIVEFQFFCHSAYETQPSLSLVVLKNELEAQLCIQ